MIALDTNVLVRFLMADDQKQTAQVHDLFLDAETKSECFLVLSVVLLELIWVLESAYAISREKIIDALSALSCMAIFKFEHANAVRDMLENAKRNRNDLSDLLIGHIAAATGCAHVWSFDKKACRLPLFHSINPRP